MSEEKAPEAPIVLVTGASGFVGGHCIQQLLDSNLYRVRGTVRSVSKYEGKMEYFKRDDHKYQLELVEANLGVEEGWKEAVKDCSYVLHVASPVPTEQPKDEMEVVGPALSGVEFVVSAALNEPKMKRVIYTSSISAVHEGLRNTVNVPFTEEHWSKLDTLIPYSKSKHLAEKRFWELINAQTDTNVGGVSINPGFILGPVINGTYNASQEMIRRIINREMPMVPDVYYGVIDVRDVATSHISAMTNEKAPGNRYICVSETIHVRDMCNYIKDEFKQYGYNPPTRVAPNFLLSVLSICDDAIKSFVLPYLGWNYKFDATKIRDDGVLKEFYSPKDMTIAMAHSLIDYGAVKDKRPYKEGGYIPSSL